MLQDIEFMEKTDMSCLLNVNMSITWIDSVGLLQWNRGNDIEK